MLSLAARLFLCLSALTHFNNRKEPQTILTYDPHGHTGPSNIKALIEKSLDADKALDIVTIDLDDQTGLADHIIVASGTSSRHVSAIAQKLKDRLNIRGIQNVRIEGLEQSDWVVLDAGDVILHLFRPEVREFYNIEKMWGMVIPDTGADTAINV